MRRQATEWKIIFAKDLSDERLFLKIYKEHLKLTNKKMNGLITKWAKYLKRYLTKKAYKWQMSI